MLTISCGADLIGGRVYFVLSGEMERGTYETDIRDHALEILSEDYFNYAVGGFAICGGKGRESARSEGV
jgi:hypothetical protein